MKPFVPLSPVPSSRPSRGVLPSGLRRFLTQNAAWWPWAIAGWLLACALWGGWLLHGQRVAAQEDFDLQSRILHRLLSQRAEQHEAVFAALVALEPSLPQITPEVKARFAGSIMLSYPQIDQVRRYLRNADGSWRPAAPNGAGGEMLPRLTPTLESSLRSPVAPALADAAGIWLARAAGPDSAWALHVRTDRLLAAGEQPPAGFSFTLATDDGQVLWDHPASRAHWMSLTPLQAEKHLSVRSQPYLLITRQPPLPAQLPWGRFAWGVLVLLAVCGAAAWAFVEYRRRVLTQRQLALAHASRVNAMGEVAAGIAHELNQPLAAILSNTQAVGRWLDDDPPAIDGAREAAQSAVQQARRAGAILHRLRGFISPQPGRVEAVDLNRVASAALSLVGEALQRRQVQVHLQLADGLPRVRGEQVAFEQVAVNLLLNAADALDGVPQEQRHVRLYTLLQNGQILLCVEDSGPGFSEEVRGRLFEPFFTTKPGGMGLGLSICEHIVQQAGGDLLAEHGEGGGARLVMRLPAINED
ncbi:sensor histidine kinase [Uliginosibacterium sp. H1]|uniref:sensor histidine kinase n=1 Tax=Uliginosibacterium sp. H1 TaxID=3114757 RepID=UPI002E180433|nr:ATP-binding protein [Uliginosibacterium sp. H1]